MSQGTGKKLRVELKSAIRDGLKTRGWRPGGGDSSTFEAPASLVEGPLKVQLHAMVETNKFGDATLTADATVLCPEVTDLLVGFDRDSLPADVVRWPGEEMTRSAMLLQIVGAGQLLDPERGSLKQWEASNTDEVAEAAAAFFTVVDDLLLPWVARRDTPTKVLELFGSNEPDVPRVKSSRAIRTVSVLALMEDRPQFARTLVASYEYGLGDDAERFALFERELADRFPEYGPLQRS